MTCSQCVHTDYTTILICHPFGPHFSVTTYQYSEASHQEYVSFTQRAKGEDNHRSIFKHIKKQIIHPISTTNPVVVKHIVVVRTIMPTSRPVIDSHGQSGMTILWSVVKRLVVNWFLYVRRLVVRVMIHNQGRSSYQVLAIVICRVTCVQQSSCHQSPWISCGR